MQNLFSRTMRTPSGFLSMLAVLCVVLLPALVFGQSKTAQISASQARKIALTSHPGQVVSTTTTKRHGRTYYDVYIRSGTVRRHVLVDARSGAVLAGKSGTKTNSASKIALTAYPGKVVAGPTAIQYKGRTVQQVTVQSGVVRRTVLVHTPTGSIVKTMTRHTD